jgi:hypothetical protein
VLQSGFYPVQQSISKGRTLEGLFNTTDEKLHAKLRRAVANAYAMSTLVQFEPLVDSTSKAFLEQISHRYADRSEDDESGICDFGTWLQYYAFDVIGELTFSKRLGFVDRGEDVDCIISNIEWMLDYFAVVSAVNCKKKQEHLLKCSYTSRSAKSPTSTEYSSKTLFASG